VPIVLVECVIVQAECAQVNVKSPLCSE